MSSSSRSPWRLPGLRVAVLVAALVLVLVHHAGAFMHDSERRHLREQARGMFYHGYRNYMEHAFPWDELKPLSCEGRRWDRRERGDLDDVLGGYALTLIDSLDMLAILGDRDEFAHAVQLVLEHVSFDRDVTVSVFESTIRVIGGLVSAHMLASPLYLGILNESEYHGELLDLAVDLGTRLLPAFDTPTGLPVHRVNLKRGVVKNTPSFTCPAAAGSLLVELSYLSRLSDNPIFEAKARAAVMDLWERRSDLNLLGSSIDVKSGQWIHSHVSIGAGLDSFFEYLLKYHLVSGDPKWLLMFNASYYAVETHINHDGVHIEVDMNYGRQQIRSRRVSALQAFWPGLQVLAGDVSSAIRGHEKLFTLWNKFGAMPELFDLSGGGSVISWARTSPLRPELIESTYHLYQATRDHKYLKIGRKLLQDIQSVSQVACGYAAVGDIHTLAVEDRMDSYFLSETVKYLYLLFSDDEDVIVPSMPRMTGCTSTSNCSASNVTMTRALKSSEVVFSTEGHVLMVDSTLFARNESSKSSRKKNNQYDPRLHPACENGNIQVQKRNMEISAAATGSQAYFRIGLSVRLEDSHVMTLTASPATFGLQISRKGHFEAPLYLYTQRVGEGCDKLSARDAADVAGKIVMVLRGTCTFAQKALTLQRAGAAGVIVINTKNSKAKHPERTYFVKDDEFNRGKSVKIPLVLVAREDAAELLRHAQLQELVVDENGELQGDASGSSLQITASLAAWLH